MFSIIMIVFFRRGRFINDLEDGLWIKYHDNGYVGLCNIRVN